MQTELAAKYADAGNFERASKLLLELTEANPASDGNYDAYVRMLAEQKRGEDLVKALDKALDRLKDQPISASAMKEKVRTFRLIQVYYLSNLDMFTEAQDQYIEVINKFPLDSSITKEAYDFSKEHNLGDRMLQFYEKTASKSHKNYRWHVLLAQFYESDGKIPEAISYMKTAAEVEPSKVELWQKIAELANIPPDYKTGIAASMKLFDLTEDYHYKLDAARFHFQLDEKDKAEALVMEIFAGELPDYLKYFEAAAIFKSWDIDRRAAEMFGKGLAAFKKDPYKRALTNDWMRQVTDFYAENNQLSELHSILDGIMNDLFVESNRKTNFNRSTIKSSISVITDVEWVMIPQAVSKYGRRSDHIATAARILAAVKQSDDKLFDRSIETAANYLGDYALLETLYKNKINYYRYSKGKNHWNNYYSAVFELTEYYQQRLDYKAAAGTLEKALTVYYSPDFMIELARIYNLFDEQEKRLDILGKYYEYVVSQTNYGKNVDDGFNQFSTEAYSYFQLLRELGYTTRLDSLTHEKNFFTGPYINYLIDSNDMPRAIATIDRAMSYKNPVWKNSKKALIYKHFEDPAGLPLMKSVLALDDIEGSMDHKANRGAEFIGDMWYDFSMVYAGFLKMTGGGYSDFALSLVESHPLDALSYQNTGDFFLEAGNAKQAISFYETAAGINGSWTAQLHNKTGRAYLTLGDKNKALDQWHLIISEEKHISRYVSLFNVLVENGFDKMAVVTLREGILYAASNSKLDGDVDSAVHILRRHMKLPDADWKKFVDSVFKAAGADFETAYRIAMARYVSGDALAFYMKKTAALASAMSNDDLRGYVSDYCYDSCITGCYETCSSGNCYSCEYSCDTCYNYYRDSSYVYWRMLLDHQINSGLDEGALETIADIRRLQLDNIEPMAINMFEIDALIGTGDLDATMARIKEILSEQDNDAGDYIFIDFNQQLLNAGHDKLADEVMLMLYEKTSPEYMSNADYTGLARIQLKRDMQKDALETIGAMLRAAPKSTEALAMAASLFEEFDLFEKAVDLRKRLATIEPLDYSNLVALQISRFKSGDKKDAVTELGSIILSDNVPLEVRLQAAKAVANNYDALKPDKLVATLEKSVSASELPQTVVPFIALYDFKTAAGEADAKDVLKIAVEKMYIPYLPTIELARALESEGESGARDMYLKAFGLGNITSDDMMGYALLLHESGEHDFVSGIFTQPEYLQIFDLNGSGGTCEDYESSMVDAGVSRARVAAFLQALAKSSELSESYAQAQTLYTCAATLGGHLPWNSINFRSKASLMGHKFDRLSDENDKMWDFNINLELGL